MTIFHAFHRAVFGSLAASVLLTVGCGSGLIDSTTTPMNISGNSLQGEMFGGSQPISGATIQLYEVGTTGYSSAAKPLITGSVTTQTDGSFSIASDYTCDSGSYVYITGSGGNPGGNTANPALALMAALGPCSSISSSTHIHMNEVTTIAGAYALAQFSGGSTFGTALSALGGAQATTGNPGTAAIAPADNFATSSTNIQGIANAMATAQVLANTSTGYSPGSNTNGSASPEYWQVNTLANILAACVNSTGVSAGSACSKLFSNVAPSGSTAPADTLQAAIYMALNPTSSTQSIATLYGLISGGSPFEPYADSAAAVNDLTVGVAYTPVVPSTSTKVLSTPRQIAFDSAGNAWVTNTGTGFYLAELGPTGNPIQAGTTAGVYTTTAYTVGSASSATTMVGSGGTLLLDAIALDTSDNVWGVDSNGNNIFKIAGSGGVAGGTSGGNTTAVGYSLPTTGSAPYSIAVDKSNNVFFALGGSTGKSCGVTGGTKQVGEFAAGAYGTYIAGAYGGGGPYAMAIDNGVADYTTVTGVKTTIPGSPFVWTVGEYSGGTESTGVNYGILSQQYTLTSGSASAACATPLSGSWIGGAGSTDTTMIPSITVGTDTINMMANPTILAFDSSGNAWIVNNGVNDSAGTYKYSVTRLVPNYGNAFTVAQAESNFSFTSTNLSAGVSSFLPQSMAIDGSGQVWISGAAPVLVQLNNSGSFISPTTGYAGSTYTSSGPTTTHSRYTTAVGSSGVAVDISGNVWVANGVSSSRVTVLVGAGVPVAAPLSTGLKNSTLGKMP